MTIVEIIGFFILLGNLAGLTMVILWIGLDMPVTVADFRLRFRQMFFGHRPGSGKLS